MNIYIHELKSLRKSTIIWTCALVALAAMYFSIYPGILNDAAAFKKMLGAYPATVRAMLGISIDSITSILGFYSMVFSFISLCGAIQAMIMGFSILSREMRERTADFLLVKPVSRQKIISSKLFAALTMIVATDIVYFAASFIMANMVKTAEYSVKVFFMMNLTLFFLQLIFLAIGMIVSVIFIRMKSVLPVSLGVVFGFFIIGAILATGVNDVERYLSPFKYFNFPYIIKNAAYEVQYLIAGAAVVIVSIAASYVIYTKKDIHAVS